MKHRILVGDVFSRLADLPDESVDCVITSPPYWGLRDYKSGSPLEIGKEPTFDDHLQTMLHLAREIRRVLAPHGTFWFNYGDAFATAANGRSAKETKALGKDDRTFRDKPFSTTGGIFKPKDRMLMPSRIATAIQEDGWWIRQEIIWAKKNPMPESVSDRPSSSHEKIYLFTKQPRYYYDAEAVRNPAAVEKRPRKHPRASDLPSLFDLPEAPEDAPPEIRGRSTYGRHALGDAVPEAERRKTDKQRGHSRRHAGFNDRWDAMTKAQQQAKGANLRDVWFIATKPFRGAHFATFPPDIPRICIQAGTSEAGYCSECGAPWRRQVDVEYVDSPVHSPGKVMREDQLDPSSGWAGAPHKRRMSTTKGWAPSCECDADPRPGVVLDPFGGAGTVSLVADEEKRDSIMIEINPEYAEMARKRVAESNTLMAEVTLEDDE